MKKVLVGMLALVSTLAFADPFIQALQTEQAELHQQANSIRQQMSQQEQVGYSSEEQKVIKIVRESSIQILEGNVLRIERKIRDIKNARAQTKSQQQP